MLSLAYARKILSGDIPFLILPIKDINLIGTSIAIAANGKLWGTVDADDCQVLGEKEFLASQATYVLTLNELATMFNNNEISWPLYEYKLNNPVLFDLPQTLVPSPQTPALGDYRRAQNYDFQVGEQVLHITSWTNMMDTDDEDYPGHWGLVVHTRDGKSVPLSRINPPDLSLMDSSILTDLMDALKHLFHAQEKGTIRGASKEDIVNAYIFLSNELESRQITFERDPGMDSEIHKILSKIEAVMTSIGPEGKDLEKLLRQVRKKHPNWTMEHIKRYLLGGIYGGSALTTDVEKTLEHQLTDTVIIHNFCSLIGSNVTGPKANDIDIHLRSLHRDEAIEFKIARMFDPELRDQLHFVYDPVGPRSDYIPLFDLILKKKDKFTTIPVDGPKYKQQPSDNHTPYLPQDQRGKSDGVLDLNDLNYIRQMANNEFENYEDQENA
jgi:hypothetical protein